MGKTTTTQPTFKQPKTVALSTYLQSVVIAVLVSGALAFIASYFVTINIYGDARASVSSDIVKLSKEAK